MICVFFKLPFQRQVKKIYTTRFDDLLEKIEMLCSTNGGRFSSQQNRYFFYFSNDLIAYEFSAVRFLFLLKNVLDKNIEIIQSYNLLIELTSENIGEIEVENFFEKKRTIIIDENSFYISRKAFQELQYYLEVENNDENFLHIISFPIFQDTKEDKRAVIPKESIVLHKNNKFYWAIYNFILQHPLDEKDLEHLRDQEIAVYNEVKPSLSYLRKHRFESNLAEYFIDAFSSHLSLYFKVYKKIHNGNLPLIYLADLKNETINAELQKILNIIPEAEVKELSKEIPTSVETNDHMLSLIFLLTLFSNYLFIDELTEFFISENKTADFFKDICDWLYRKDIIFEKNNLYAHSSELHDFAKNRIGKKTNTLYHRLSSFLVEKYKAGEIAPSFEFVETIRALSYTKTDEILLSVFLHRASSSEILQADLSKKYENAIFLEGLKHYQFALKLFENFLEKKAVQEIKLAIEEFKHNKFLVGEYKAMVFWANLNLRRSQLSDAANYFLYALEIAETLKDAEFLCEATFNLSVVYFLRNDLSLALKTLKNLDKSIDDNFAQNWKVKALFMKGRIYSKLGEYERAESFFLLAVDFAKQYFTSYVAVCEIWAAAMKMFNAKTYQAEIVFDKYLEVNFDASLFFLESFFTRRIIKDESEKIFFQNFDDCSTEQLLTLASERIAESSENISGFSFAEDRCIANKNSRNTAEKIFHILLLYYRGKVLSSIALSSEDKKELEHILKKMLVLANEANNEKNIYAQFFFYFCYDLSVDLNGTNSSEAISYLSKSFKLLQGRVMITNDNDVRDKYMQKNFWNAKILAAAKLQKLL